MLKRLRDWWRDNRAAWDGLKAFERMPRAERRIVFYAETAADWAFLGPVAHALESLGESVSRVTSDASDPVLAKPRSYFVGFGSARTVFFRGIEAGAFVMTLSDLETFHLKRSVHPVHYFYVFHSIASTQRVYREHAFDAYDTILCAGPHHVAEIRKTEEVYGLEPKRLLEHGYGRLDTLIADLQRAGAAPQREVPTVLIAPSWGPSSIIEHGLERMIEVLLEAGFVVTLRLHPMTVRHQPDLPERLLARHAAGGRFSFDRHINTTDTLLAADVMISEWSGAALEFAFARERPAIFIDTPPKTQNPNYARIGMPCLEIEIREQIGRLVAPDAIDSLPGVIRELLAGAPAWSERIRAVRDTTVFNIGRSGEVAARHILDTLGRNG